MKDEVLQQLLEKMDPIFYSVGTYKEHAYCLQKKGASWEVFYGQNSLHLGSRTFASKEEANKKKKKKLMEKINQPILKAHGKTE